MEYAISHSEERIGKHFETPFNRDKATIFFNGGISSSKMRNILYAMSELNVFSWKMPVTIVANKTKARCNIYISDKCNKILIEDFFNIYYGD
ncbi:hypothetical protein ELUMI_v1c04170 [Williamsoniiplasma luminosum]|uniref:Uncharacterized protein n=1 Tax=Williamsoniiplasma luminosum TaxID=214888 RepID=A0A2K8NWM8_9MOLU|nr:hypothetical protein [Williamsoniiplasma luminosum]ATZ17141.1 hypothetical protein ELUMI_v1c04170 [Williamsoniiplasma luminosum]